MIVSKYFVGGGLDTIIYRNKLFTDEFHYLMVE
jgi:hypothetical protein